MYDNKYIINTIIYNRPPLNYARQYIKIKLYSIVKSEISDAFTHQIIESIAAKIHQPEYDEYEYCSHITFMSHDLDEMHLNLLASF